MESHALGSSLLLASTCAPPSFQTPPLPQRREPKNNAHDPTKRRALDGVAECATAWKPWILACSWLDPGAASQIIAPFYSSRLSRRGLRLDSSIEGGGERGPTTPPALSTHPPPRATA